jgi:hypothetical protein
VALDPPPKKVKSRPAQSVKTCHPFERRTDLRDEGSAVT